MTGREAGPVVQRRAEPGSAGGGSPAGLAAGPRTNATIDGIAGDTPYVEGLAQAYGTRDVDVPDWHDELEGESEPIESFAADSGLAATHAPQVRVVGSTGPTSLAHEEYERGGVFTADLLERMRASGSMDSALDDSTRARFERYHRQLPTELRMGKRREAAGGDGAAPRKQAVYLANSNYRSAPALPGALRDAHGMEAALSGQGYESTGVQQDLGGDQLRSSFTAPMTGESPGVGADVVVYYSGHGSRSGLVGVDSVEMPHADVTRLVSWATDEQVNLRVILDACYSGGAGDTARSEYASKLGQAAAGDSSGLVGELVATARELVEVRNEFVDHVRSGAYHGSSPSASARGAIPVAGRDVVVSPLWRESREVAGHIQAWWDQRARPCFERCQAAFSRLQGFYRGPPSARAMFARPELHTDRLDDAINDLLAAIEHRSG